MLLPIVGSAGRSVGTTGVSIGDALVTRTPVGSHVLPTVSLGRSGATCQGWLFVGWRDPVSKQDPIVWQGDVAVVDAGAQTCAVLPITVSEGLLLGELCSRVLPVPNNPHLNGSCVVVQYVLASGSTYCVSNVAASPVFGSGPPATSAQTSAANASWRAALQHAQSPPSMSTILQSLQGR
jgi:hypothetical protein